MRNARFISSTVVTRFTQYLDTAPPHTVTVYSRDTTKGLMCPYYEYYSISTEWGQCPFYLPYQYNNNNDNNTWIILLTAGCSDFGISRIPSNTDSKSSADTQLLECKIERERERERERKRERERERQTETDAHTLTHTYMYMYVYIYIYIHTCT